MATAEIAPIVGQATQGPPGIGTPSREPEPDSLSQVMKLPLPVCADIAAPGTGKTTEITFEVKGSKLSVTLLDEPPSARPEKSVLFAGRLGPDHRLLKAIPLQVSNEDGQVVLTWEETDDFACGANTGEALDHFGRSILELYQHLHSHDVVLGADLLRIRDVLDRYIVDRKSRK